MKNKTNYEKVREFHQAMGQPLDQKWERGKLEDLRLDLVHEEFMELMEGSNNRDVPNVLKELSDILYVVYGYAATYGWDIDAAFNRVHQSNMSKLGEDGKPIYREDGKVMKGPNYKPVELEDLVMEGYRD